ncbi:hypothetical protein AB0I49_36740 [Streptomyces sp. NPDC050617]|uniref:hypothetical protein n=1 Tax=Streptomyces sp. NPDC050617 TaxID=3154628 RepID=UPI0034422C4C
MAWRDFWGLCRSRGPVGWASAFVVGGMWWWAALRLLVEPGRVGFVEGTVVAGGWGLSLLPVHCVPWSKKDDGRRRKDPKDRKGRRRHTGCDGTPPAEGVRAAAAPFEDVGSGAPEVVGSSRPEEAGSGAAEVVGCSRPEDVGSGAAEVVGEVTKAYGRRRWGGGAGRS